MFKLIKRILLLAALSLAAFYLTAFFAGGGPIRWVGERIEDVGRAIHNQFNRLGEEADRIKRKKKKIVRRVDKVKDDAEGLIER
jgi:hypothetical protein